MPLYLLEHDLRAGEVMSFLPTDHPANLREWVDLSGQKPEDERVVERTFLASEAVTEPAVCVILDYIRDNQSLNHLLNKRRLPTWLRPVVSAEAVFWLFSIPTDKELALERLDESLTWGSPFPTVAVRGDQDFDELASNVLKSGRITSELQVELARHTKYLLVNAFDWVANVLWLSPEASSAGFQKPT
jgi:hypothetical protein